jgi:hypothetical protein
MRGGLKWACALVMLGACTPALNWRAVPLDRLSVLLPCKPDRATRSLQLGTVQTSMEMAGCVAANNLVAVSHVHAQSVELVQPLLQDWRTRALQNMRSQSETPLALPPKVVVFMDATGTQTDGARVQARLAWLVDGQDIYHVAVYAPKLMPEVTDTLFSELKLQ